MDSSIINFPSVFTDKQLDYIAQNVIDAAHRVLPGKLRDVILYGSYARGDYQEWSDVDIMILADLDGLNTQEVWRLDRALMDTLSDLCFHMNLLLSTIITPYDRFEQMKESYPFYRNVNREGKRLWPIAFV